MEKSQATNDGEYQATEVVAMSGPIIVSKQRFLRGVVIKRRNGIAQAVNMGDIIAIENIKGRQKKSFLPGRWSIAQVLGFQGTEHVMVLHLRHVKEVSKLISNSKFVTEYVRVDNSLAVSRLVETFVEVRRILPISIHLLQEKVYQRGNVLRYICDDLVEEWCYQCHFVLPETMDGSFPAEVNDPVYLQPQTDELSQSVSDALHLIDLPNLDALKLAKRLAEQYTSPRSTRFQLLQSSTPNIPLQPQVVKRKKEYLLESDDSDVRSPAQTKKRAKKESPAIVKKTKKTCMAPKGDTSSSPKASFHVELGLVCCQKQIKESTILFYDTITLKKSWKIRVGSFVTANHEGRRHSPTQVLSIYRKKDESSVFLEVRWFYRISELPRQLVLPSDLQKDEVIEVDEDVFHVEPANLVRPIRLSSNMKRRPKDVLLCRYAFSIRQFSFSSSDTLTPITHWSGQESTRIGMDCPKGFPGKIPELLQSYGGSDEASVVAKGKVCATWSDLELSRVGNVTAGTVIITASDGTSYFEYIEWRPLAERFALSSTAKRLCKARIGDTVCIMEATEGMCEPFAGPWRLVQVLAIYRKPGESRLWLEVRRCLRSSDLPSSVQSWSPKVESNEYFESDIVERNVMASRLLAPAQVVFKENRDRRSFEESGIRVRCPFFFLSKVLRIQSLISHGDEALQKSWFVQRGICHSAMIREVSGLKAGMQFCIPSHPSGLPSFSSASSVLADGTKLTLKDPDTGLETLLSCSLRPRWDKVLDSFCLLPGDDEVKWRCRIGDLVAVEETTQAPGMPSQQWPFTVNWRPAQVLAFSSTSQGTSEVMQVRLRFFQFRIDEDHSNHEDSLPSVCSSTDIDPNWQNASRLLGPILLIPSPKDAVRYKNPWGWWYPFAPTNAVVYLSTPEPLENLFENGLNMLLQCCSTKENFHRVVRGLVESDQFAGEGVQLPLICAIDRLNEKENVDAKPNVQLTNVSTVRTIGSPLYKDANSSYFEEASVEVPSTLFTLNLTNDSFDLGDKKVSLKRFVWTVKIGDPVILRHDTPRSRRQPFVYWSSRVISNPTFGPFVVPAAVGEIVTIRKESRGNIMLEVRWFFRESEISGSLRSEDLTCQEILESDLFDDIVAEHLIAPVCLYSQPREITQDLSIEGIPLVEFYCSRFWSAIRKCSVPVAGLDGRVARGQAKSKRLCGNLSLASALKSLIVKNAVCVGGQEPSANWQVSFEKTISKLSLTDAAKETDDSLAAIVGREVERRKISAFVQDALSGSQDMVKRPSLFVAGPPGKNCFSSKCVVTQNKSKEQGKRRILNGMETRHPHDIYGMFWDELESSGNGRLNSKEAASKLKKYFTAGDSDPERSSELIIVMLDEIDYVMTKGQEVLYDMFDLPLLSMEKKNGKQLLMIGVSNMLNLPDKLHPRVQSRIGSARVFFRSYSVDETRAILLSKVKAASPNYEVFHSDAILYASKKTSAMSGDIRKAFQMCKQAAELVLEDALKSSENKRTVFIKDVLRVSRDSFNSAQSRTIALCTSLEALLIVTLASLSKTTGREFGGFDVEELVTRMASVANSHGDSQYLPPPNLEETLVMLRNLGGSNLMTLDNPQNASLSYRASLAGSGGAWPLVSLLVDDVAVLVALKDTNHHRLAQKHLGRQ